ncbi:MAG: hypothetical protein ACR2KJ_18535 [Jatrophihabitans sp.]
MGSIGEAAQRLPELLSAARQLAPDEQESAVQQVLSAGVHDLVMHATGSGDVLPQRDLEMLADAVRTTVPAAAEDALEPRVRVFVRLLRAGALPPAWTLAADNGSGTVQQRVDFSTSSGAARTSLQLPLFMLVDGGRAYGWLPGFRDPRWGVPDSVFDVSADVVLRSSLDEARIAGDRLVLSGWAYLTLLATSAEDTVAVAFDNPDGHREVVPARRLRRSDLVKGTGEDLTRLAWAGWAAEVDLRRLAARPGDWRVTMSLAHGELARTAELAEHYGPLAGDSRLHDSHEIAGHAVRVVPSGAGLTVRVRELTSVARFVPRPLRSVARSALR